MFNVNSSETIVFNVVKLLIVGNYSLLIIVKLLIVGNNY